MENFVTHLATNWLLYIEYALAVAGGMGGVIFIAGFAGGLPHLFTYSEDAAHMEHARTRALWGIYLAMVALGLWEIIRVFMGEAPLSMLTLSILLLTPLWIPPLYRLLTGTSGH